MQLHFTYQHFTSDNNVIRTNLKWISDCERVNREACAFKMVNWSNKLYDANWMAAAFNWHKPSENRKISKIKEKNQFAIDGVNLFSTIFYSKFKEFQFFFVHPQHLRFRLINRGMFNTLVTMCYLRTKHSFQHALQQHSSQFNVQSKHHFWSFTLKLEKCLADAQLVSIETIFELVITNVCESNCKDKSKQNAD